MENKVQALIKQNESIFNSLKMRNIQDIGELISLSDTLSIEQNYEVLSNYNNRLKELVKNNKPEKKVEPKPEKKVEPKPEKIIETKDEDDEDIEYSDPIKKFETITNMEDIKRFFFSGNYEEFNKLVKEHNFKLYNVNYKYASDKDGCPTFSAKNLVGGFVRNFDDYRKYCMICFRCIRTDTDPITYKYPSLWIVNSNDDIKKIIGTLYDDFEFIEVIDNKDIFYKNMEKMNSDDKFLIGESYVH